MNATIEHGKLIHVAPIALIPATGPVSIPEMRVEEDLLLGVRLAIGAGDKPSMTFPCASREVAERTRRFFGGTAT